MSTAERELRGTGTATRLGIGAQVLLTVGLALAACVTVIWLSGRPGVRRLVDMTAEGRNTLSPQSMDILRSLPEPIEIDVFFRRFDPPLTEVAGAAQERMFDLLILAEKIAPDKIRLRHHDLSRPDKRTEIEERMRELRLKEIQTFVVSGARRRTTVHLLGDVCEVDLGDPREESFRPPSLTLFRGEEALMSGLLKVTQGQRRKVLFSTGHGEYDLYGDGDRDYGELQTSLVAEGFDPAWWEGDEDGPIPDDVSVLAILGPAEPFSAAELEHVRAFLAAGGRVVAAPGETWSEDEGSLPALLAEYGVRVLPGYVARPVIGVSGRQVFCVEQCAEVIVRGDGMSARHPITEPLRRAPNRRVRLAFTRALERGKEPPGTLIVPLLRTTDVAWRDLPDAQGVHDWCVDAERETPGNFYVSMAVSFPPAGVVPGERIKQMGEERPEARVLVLGSALSVSNVLFDSNRDFALNGFNWAASRDYRIRVAPRQIEDRRIEVGEGQSLFFVNLVGSVLLPGAAAAIGALVFFLRRR